MKWVLLFIAAALVVAPGAHAAAGDIDCVPHKPPKAVVLLFHGGAFVFGDASMTADTCALLADNGYLARSVNYPLSDLAGAFETANQEVAETKRLHPKLRLFTYGESAGGALALYPAAKGRVSGVFAWAPVSQLTTGGCTVCPWDKMRDASYAQRRALSPYTVATAKSSPARVVQGTSDTYVPAKYAKRLAKRWSKLRLSLRKGETHLTTQPAYLHASVEALAWFNQQTRHRTSDH